MQRGQVKTLALKVGPPDLGGAGLYWRTSVLFLSAEVSFPLAGWY